MHITVFHFLPTIAPRNSFPPYKLLKKRNRLKITYFTPWAVPEPLTWSKPEARPRQIKRKELIYFVFLFVLSPFPWPKPLKCRLISHLKSLSLNQIRSKDLGVIFRLIWRVEQQFRRRQRLYFINLTMHLPPSSPPTTVRVFKLLTTLLITDSPHHPPSTLELLASPPSIPT